MAAPKVCALLFLIWMDVRKGSALFRIRLLSLSPHRRSKTPTIGGRRQARRPSVPCKRLRPTLIWMDVRAADEAADVAATGDPALRLNSAGKGPVSAEWMIPKALWIKRHQPAIYEKAHAICEYQDYLNYRLTGRYVGCLNNVSIRWHWINREKPLSLLGRLGLEDLAEKWPDEVVAPGDPLAGLT